MARRREFLRQVAVGSAAYLGGCAEPAAPPAPDAGSGPVCGQDPPPEPPALDYPAASYFEALGVDLDAAGIGSPVVLLDMDRVDGNIDAIAAGIPPPLHYRIVEKSLPSLDLLAYVSSRAATNRFLVMHLPFLAELLGALPAAEVLVGKAHLTSAVARFFDAQPATEHAALAARVAFLADGPERLAELEALASRLGVTLRVAVEIDVGLRRSGLGDPAELPALLDVFLASTTLQLAGLLGYDGHIAHSPAGTRSSLDAAWAAATQVYQSFVDVLRQPRYAALDRPDLIFDSGGTASFPMYTSGTPVNDVAAGGGVLRPGTYPDHVISALRPAIFIATPVLRQYAEPRMPFFTAAQSACLLANLQGLTLQGGVWPSHFSHPAGIRPAPFMTEPGDHPMVPNQALCTAPAATPLSPGDWVFFHPLQADALFQFEEILLVRGGRLTPDRMAPYPRRY